MGNKKHQIVIIGGGTGGVMVAAQLKRAKSNLNIAIIDPTDTHIYQPANTLVGAGLMDYEDTLKDEKKMIPSGVSWIKERVNDIDPENNEVKLENGDSVTYEYLVAAPGIQINLDGIKGLKEAYGKNGVCSNYIDPKYTWEVMKEFKGGNALFTQPASPIKCPGAPQKIMYLMGDYVAKHNLIEESNIIFATPGTMIFGVQPFKDELEKYLIEYNVKQRYGYKLVEIDGKNKEAIYERLELPNGSDKYVVNDERNAAGCMGYVVDGDIQREVQEVNSTFSMEKKGTRYSIKYDMLHLAPPQSAPTWFQKTKLANPDGPNKGWMGVDKNSLQSVYYKNVFGVGDVTDLPTARTGAAIRKQAPVVVKNILSLMAGKEASHKGYTGYSSCPLVVSPSKMLLAEFGYEGKRMSDPILSKIFDTGKASYPMWILKRHGLPFMYWNMMMKGYDF
ncbi:MAG: NAD(P)/FAD-dependent oxidoreductase [Salibacteraceae bacterium]